MNEDRIPPLALQAAGAPWCLTPPTRILKDMMFRSYNSGVIELWGDLFLATRVQAGGACRAVIKKLSMSGPIPRAEPVDGPLWLDAGGRVNPWSASTGDLGPPWKLEDMRLFEFGGRVCGAFTAARYDEPGRFVSLQAFVEFASEGSPLLPDFWKPLRTVVPQFGGNIAGGVHPAREKNWMPYVHEGKLHVVYAIAPKFTVVRFHGLGEAVDRVEHAFLGSCGFAWPYGNLAGGTPPIVIGNRAEGWRCLTFYHGSVGHPKAQRRYYMGALEFDPDEPGLPERIRITRPLLWASGREGAIENPDFPHWMPYVVFPTGLVRRGNELLVTMGVNDSYDALMRVDLAHLQRMLEPVETFCRPVKRRFTGAVETSDPQLAAALLEAGMKEE